MPDPGEVDDPTGAGELLRRAMTRLSSGVAVITCTWDGRPHAMTATAVCSVSLDPPLILVCVSRTSRFHHAVTHAGRWAVSLLSADQESAARHFSDRGRDLATQFDGVGHLTGAASRAPLLLGSLAWLECATHQLHDGGDHTIVLGRVLDATTSPAEPVPLTYYRGAYA